MSTPRTIRLVSFDIWKTLIKPNPTFGNERARLTLEHFGLDMEPVTFRSFISAACKQLEDGTDRTGVQYGFMPRTRLALELSGYASPVTDDDLRKIYRAVRQLQLSSTANMPTLTEDNLPLVFRALRDQGREIAVVSNTGMTEGAELTEILSALGLNRYINHHIYSDEVGHAKPSPKIFARLAEVAKVYPGEILHIGDNRLADLEGARASGLQARQYLPGQADSVDVLSHFAQLAWYRIDRIERQVATAR